CDFVRIVRADHDEAERFVGFVDEAVPQPLAGGKANVFASFEAKALFAPAQSAFALERDDVLFLDQMIMERHALLAGRELFIADANLALFLAARVRQHPEAIAEPRAAEKFLPRHALDRDRATRLVFAHVLVPRPGSR